MLSFFQRVERVALHPGLTRDRHQHARARLFLWLCLTAGPALLAVVVAWGLSEEEGARAAIIGCGHTAVICLALSLRFFPTLTVPARLFALGSVLQLTSAAWWTGGLQSLVVGTFPVATMFLGFIHNVRTALLGGVGLALGLGALAVAPQLGHHPGPPIDTPWVLAFVALWAVGTGLGVAVLHQHLTDTHLDAAAEQLAMRTAAQQEAERLRDQWQGFVRYVSHELRNPLTTISGNLELLELTDEAQRKARHLQSVHLASDRLVRLANDVLDFASLEQGRIALRRQPLRLDEVAAACVAELGSQAAPGQTLTVEGEVEVRALADRDRLLQVLGNLVLNAFKYAEGAPVTIRVRRAAHGAQLLVSDTGPGIPEALRPELFAPFSRAENTRRTGNGLGLAIARNLMRSMGGDLELIEGPGPGAQFLLTLPLEPAPPPD